VNLATCAWAHPESVPEDIVSLGGSERRSRAQRLKGWLARFAAGRGRVVAIAAVAAFVVTIPVTAVILSSGSSGQAPGNGGDRNSGGMPPAPAVPAGTVARIPLSRVVSIAGDAGQLWAVRFLGRASGEYELVKIDVHTDKIMLRVTLGQAYEAVAAGAGTVWLTRPFGRMRGQLERVDPATGHVVKIVRLPGVWCGSLTFSAGSLLAECRTRPPGAKFVLLNPMTGTTEWASAPVSDAASLAAAAPDGVWYTTPVGISGLERAGSSARPLITRAYSVSLALTQSLVYSGGFIWAMTGDEKVAKIDPDTGKIVRIYTYRTYDPGFVGSLRYLAVGQGSLWFLGEGQLSGVLRVSIATGMPIGWVLPRGLVSCGQPCGAIYDTQGAVWVPTTKWLIKITG